MEFKTKSTFFLFFIFTNRHPCFAEASFKFLCVIFVFASPGLSPCASIFPLVLFFFVVCCAEFTFTAPGSWFLVPLLRFLLLLPVCKIIVIYALNKNTKMFFVGNRISFALQLFLLSTSLRFPFFFSTHSIYFLFFFLIPSLSSVTPFSILPYFLDFNVIHTSHTCGDYTSCLSLCSHFISIT